MMKCKFIDHRKPQINDICRYNQKKKTNQKMIILGTQTKNDDDKLKKQVMEQQW